MPTVLRFLVLSALLAVGAVAAEPDTVVGPITAPVSDSWAAMVARSSAGAKAAAAPRLRHAPRHWQTAPRLAPTSSPRTASAATQLPRFANPVTPGTAFATLDFNDTGGWVPPDTMGTVGPNHYVVTLNSEIGIYDRTGVLLSSASFDTFFNSLTPVQSESDPHVIFDAGSQRWFVSCIELGDDGFGNPADNDALLAVSATTDPTGTWTFYRVPLGVPNSAGHSFLNDYDSIGTDANGVYIGVALFEDDVTGLYARVAAIEKSHLLAATAFTPTIFNNLTDFYAVPQAARTTDAVAATGKAWLVDGSATVAAEVRLRSITWSGAAGSRTAAISATITLATAPCAQAPNAGSLNGIDPIDVGDLRMLMATKRNGHLWTCRTVGVDASGGAGIADRAACQWLDIDLSSGTPTMSQQGIVFDSASSNPRFYFFPAVIPNGQGHAAMGFSGCRANEFVGAYDCGRLAGSPSGQMSAVTLLKAGEAKYASGDNPQRWGDYSHISLDPLDDMSFWTTQEYAKGPTASFLWGTWTAQLLAPPPATPSSAAPAFLTAGATGVSIVVTGASSNGAGFFDPGVGFTSPTVVVSGAGITVNSVTVNSPTQATVSVDVAGGAASGARTVTFTNPDGQSAAGSLLSVGMPTVDLSLSGSPFAENGGVATVTATLSFVSPVATTVGLSFGGTATAGSDYVASAASIVIPAGLTTGSITLSGQDDLVNDPGETAIVTAGPFTNATAGANTQVTATITEVAPPTVDLSLTGSPFAENGGVATVTATLSRASTAAVTANLTLSGTATAGSDYVASAASIVIPAGSTTGSITLTGQDDLVADPGETVVVDLGVLTNVIAGTTTQVTATITDVTPVSADLSLAGSPFSEHGGAATMFVTLSRACTLPVTVQLGYGGTAAAGRYSAPPSITVAAGSTSMAGLISGVDDGAEQADQTIVVTVTGLTNALPGATQQVTAVETSDDHPSDSSGCGIGGIGVLLLLALGFMRRRQSLA